MPRGQYKPGVRGSTNSTNGSWTWTVRFARIFSASRDSAQVAEQQTRAFSGLHVAFTDAAPGGQNANRFIPCKHRNPQSSFGFDSKQHVSAVRSLYRHPAISIFRFACA